METTKITYYRLDSSPYHKEDFLTVEEERFRTLGIEKSDSPFQANILISNTHSDFSKCPMTELTKVELLIHPNSGHDNIPVEFVKEAHFPIICGNSIRAHGVAEYSLGRLFHHFSNLESTSTWSPGRKWPRERLADKRVLILGKGKIGTIISLALTPLAKEVRVYDPFVLENELDLSGIQVVIIAASLNQTSKHIVNKNFLNALTAPWVLVNGARGKIVNQSDLIDSLKSNPKNTAYLDVFEKEPFHEEEFIGLKNIHCSSHVAGVSENLDQLIIDFEEEVLKKFMTQRSSFEDYYALDLLQNKLSPDKSFLI